MRSFIHKPKIVNVQLVLGIKKISQVPDLIVVRYERLCLKQFRIEMYQILALLMLNSGKPSTRRNEFRLFVPEYLLFFRIYGRKIQTNAKNGVGNLFGEKCLF